MWLSGAVTACNSITPDPADLILVDGAVITLSNQDVVEALAVRDERIIAIGSNADIREYQGPQTYVIELAGRTVIPGLTDNHFHGIGGGGGVDLAGARSLQEVLSAISTRAEETPPGDVIVTNSDWHEGQLDEQRLPYRDDLDQATQEHPVVVIRGGHEYVLNSAALAYWDIDESSQAVEGGRIGRYVDGRLNGELVDRAKGLVQLPLVEDRSSAEIQEDLLEGHRILSSRGITSIRYPGASPEMYDMLLALREEDRLNIRVDFLYRGPRSGSPEVLNEVMQGWTQEEGDDFWLRVGGVKLGVDGGFEGGLMREPYEEPWGEGGTFYGLQTLPRESFLETVQVLHSAGWRVATHAVGDAAIDLVLDAYEAVNAESSIALSRWVIEHGFIPRSDQLPRMKDLGLAVSAQNHLYLAAPSLMKYWGEERAAWTTPVRTYLDNEIPLSLGTDSPVVPYDPWWVLHHFTTRETISSGVVGADQKLSRDEALRAATEGYAYLTFSEDHRGTLAVGKLADLAVTAENYLTCADPCLETMLIDITIVGGRIVWER
tara:strand:+ start:4655 stop:6295 length:1641 start_codon:yes stop_codon:yes gene_type:complete